MKSFVRSAAHVLSIFLTSPIWIPIWCAAQLSKSVGTRLFQQGSQTLALIPGDLGNILRRGFYSQTLLFCSPRCTISFGTIFATANVSIGDGVYIGAYCSIADCVIEADCMLGSFVSILSGKRTHKFDLLDVPMRLQGGEITSVTLHRDCWIGNGAIVLVDLPQGVVVGAGSVVTKSPPAASVVAGNPARVIRSRDAQEHAASPSA